MSQWETINGKSVETGLSPGQTGGTIGDTYYERPPNVPTTEIYKPMEGSQSFTAERDASGNIIKIVRYDIDKYGNVVRIGIHPGSGGRVQEYGIQNITPELRETIDRNPPITFVHQQIPSPFQLGQVQYAPSSPFGKGYFTSLEYQKPSQSQFPSTPIDYSQQQRSEQYWSNLTPFQKGAGLVGGSIMDIGVASSFIQSRFTPSESLYKERIYELIPKGESKSLMGAGQYAWRGLTGEIATTGMMAFGVGYGLSALKLSPMVLKGLGYGAIGLQTYETGKSLSRGEYGEAITGAGMFAASLPFVQAGYTTKLPLTKMFGTSAASRAAIADYNIQVREGFSSVKPQGLRLIDVESHNILVGERVSYAPKTTFQKMFGGETPYKASAYTGKPLSISSKIFGQRVSAQPELRALGEQFHNIEVMERVPFEPRTPVITKMFGRPAQLPIGLEIKGEMFHNIDVMERVPSSARALSTGQKMFGRGEFIKPQKVSVLDIMLVRPQPMYKQLTRSPVQTGFRTRSGLRGSYVSEIRSIRAGRYIGITSGLRQDTGSAITPTLASGHINKTRTELMTGNVLRLSPASIQRVSPIQSSATVQQYIPIQAYEQVQKQISREMQRTRQRTPVLSRGVFPELNLKKLKFPSLSTYLMQGKKKRKGRISGFKFPELTGVAAPRDIMKGMFSTSTKRRKARKSRKAKR